MSVFYLAAIPWLTALLLLPLRKIRWLPSILSALAMSANCLVCVNLAAEQTQWVFGRPLVWDSLARSGLLLVFASMGVIYLHGIQVTLEGILYPLGLGIAGGLALAVLFRTFVITVLLLAVIGVLAAILIPSRDRRSSRTAIAYLTISVLAIPPLLLASWFMDQFLLNPDGTHLIHLIAAALTLGFAILLGSFPFHVWLPPIARSASPGITGLITGPISLVILISFVRVVSRQSWLASNTQLWSIVEMGGVATVIIGGLLAYSARETGRMWAYVSTASLGFVLIGLASSSTIGLVGGMFQATIRCIATVLLSMCIGTVREFCTQEELSDLRGVARRFPLTVLGIAIGGLSLAGLPPTGGFVGHWLIYRSLGDRGSWPLLTVLLLSSAAVVWRLVRTLSSAVSQPGPGARSREPLLSSLVILAVSLLLLVAGMYPGPLIDLVRSLASILPQPPL